MKTSVERVQSADGTSIAIEVTGHGSAIVLIGGAFNDRTTTAGLAQVLAPYYRAVTYDRRGRGESGDESAGYTADREMEDLKAVIDQLGGTAALVGHSSGAVLALEAAIRRLPVDKVVAYEPPFIPEGRGHAAERDVGLPHSPRPLAALRRRAVRARFSGAGQPAGPR
jgi:pimeloyl-ACP methyl ester carboxylesterase